MRSYTIFVMLVTAILLSSCSREERDNIIGEQEREIEVFLNNMSKNRVVKNQGVFRVVLLEGSGAPLMKGDSLTYEYIAKIFRNGDSAIFDTNIPSVAKKIGLDISVRRENIGNIMYGEYGLIKGLQLGLDSVKAGEKCYIVFSSPFGYDDKSFCGLPKNSPLLFEIEIKRIKKN